MTIEEAVAFQPMWVQWWLIVLTTATIALPVLLVFHNQTRIIGIIVLLKSLAGGFGVQWLFDELGYVRLLSLPHVILWTPALIYLFIVLRRPAIATWARHAGIALAAVLAVSLAFDWWSLIMYLLGQTAPVNIPV